MKTWLDELRDRLASHTRTPLTPAAGLRRAGVFAPLYVREGELWVLFTKRTAKLETHPGQVSFPGGARDDGDADLLATALRETEEELGLPREKLAVLGALSPIATVTDFYVEPYVGAIPYPLALSPSKDEIEELWEIPVSALMSPTAVEERAFPGREEPVLYYHYGPKTVWGATARILSELLEVLAGEPN